MHRRMDLSMHTPPLRSTSLNSLGDPSAGLTLTTFAGAPLLVSRRAAHLKSIQAYEQQVRKCVTLRRSSDGLTSRSSEITVSGSLTLVGGRAGHNLQH